MLNLNSKKGHQTLVCRQTTINKKIPEKVKTPSPTPNPERYFNHRRKVHTGGPVYRCEECGAEFISDHMSKLIKCSDFLANRSYINTRTPHRDFMFSSCLKHPEIGSARIHLPHSLRVRYNTQLLSLPFRRPSPPTLEIICNGRCNNGGGSKSLLLLLSP